MSDITNLKTITNSLLVPITVKNNENPHQTFTVTESSGWNGDMWVPWVNSQADMLNKGIMLQWKIGTGEGRIYVFQHGPDVCYAMNDDFEQKARLGGIRGEKGLVIESNHSYKLV